MNILKTVNHCSNNGANNTSAIAIKVNNGHSGNLRFNRFNIELNPNITLFTQFNSHN